MIKNKIYKTLDKELLNEKNTEDFQYDSLPVIKAHIDKIKVSPKLKLTNEDLITLKNKYRCDFYIDNECITEKTNFIFIYTADMSELCH